MKGLIQILKESNELQMEKINELSNTVDILTLNLEYMTCLQEIDSEG